MGFSEVLLIKPKLDQTDAKKMEDDLNGRFGRVATKFGKGMLKALVGGGVITAALSAINRLLNPLEEVEDRIKALLGQSDSISDSAEKFGTTAGRFFKLQQLGHAAGLDDSGLKELLTKFQEAQKLAQKELADPSQGVHRSTLAIQQFAGEKDVADALYRALQDLQTKDKGTREEVQRAIFGDKLTGSARRFAESDFAGLSKKLGVENSSQLDQAFQKTGTISSVNKTFEAQRGIQQFMEDSKRINLEVVNAINESEKLRITREAKQLESFQDLKEAAKTIEALKVLVQTGLNQVEKLLGLLAPLAPLIHKISESRFLKLGIGGKK
jgi:hypothetical protein